jgi:hypothetical protein
VKKHERADRKPLDHAELPMPCSERRSNRTGRHREFIRNPDSAPPDSRIERHQN